MTAAAMGTAVAAFAATGPLSAGGVKDAARADCPGKIVCPLTGELVCLDRCPADVGEKLEVAAGVTEAIAPRSCCRSGA